jgi:hypothetical protein
MPGVAARAVAATAKAARNSRVEIVVFIFVTLIARSSN